MGRRGEPSVARAVSTGQWLGTALLLAGVLTGQVGVAGLLVATWLENVAAGSATVRALLRGDQRGPVGSLTTAPVDPAPPSPAAPGERSAPDTGRVEDTGLSELPAGCAVPFFVLHYGSFTLAHGMFLAVGGNALLLTPSTAPGAGQPSLGGGVVGALVLLGATIARAVRDVEPAHAIKEAYAGVVTLHLAIVLGGGLGGVLLAPALIDGGAALPVPVETLAALALVALFTVSDLVRARVVARDRAR